MGRAVPRLIAGLVPEATGKMADDMRTALDDRAALIEDRARAIAETAVSAREPWTRSLGEPPTDPRQKQRWLHQVRILAAYRDRYTLNAAAPLGSAHGDRNQQLDLERARTALHTAQQLAAAMLERPAERPAELAQDRSQPTL